MSSLGPTDADVVPAVRKALAADAAVVLEILREAEIWLAARGEPMWEAGELDPAAVAAEVAAGQFFLAERRGVPVGVLRFQLEDPLFWPDLPRGESAFVHRLAVRRRDAGTGVSHALLRWAIGHARALGRRHLRLDCDHQRTRLRALYEDAGFRLHSYRQVGPYHVARYECRLGDSDIKARSSMPNAP